MNNAEIFSYSDEPWGSLSNTRLDHLQRLQTRARTVIERSRLEMDGVAIGFQSQT